MIRTQISLTREEKALLEQRSQETGRSMSALIRDAVRTTYGTGRSVAEDLSAMRQAFGAWQGRKDGAAIVHRMRSGSRLESTASG